MKIKLYFYLNRHCFVACFVLMFLLFPAMCLAADRYSKLETEISIRPMTLPEQKGFDQETQRLKKNDGSLTEKAIGTANYGLSVAAGSGESITDNTIKAFKHVSKTKISKGIQKVTRVSSVTAQKAAKGSKGFIKNAGKAAALLDHFGTAVTTVTAYAYDDDIGAAEGLTDGLLSGGAATAGTFLATAGAAAIYGAPLGPLGMAAAGLVGGIAGSIAYNELGAPQVRKMGDAASNAIQDQKQKNQHAQDRIRVDMIAVYPDGPPKGFKASNIDPAVLHAQAEAIRAPKKKRAEAAAVKAAQKRAEQEKEDKKKSGTRFTDALDMVTARDECPSDPNKTKPGVCGCNVPENFTDQDKDGVFDCVDNAVALTVPSVIGFDSGKAASVIEGAHLTLSPSVGNPASDVSEEYQIYSQDPAGGTVVHPNTPVVKVLLHGKYKEKLIMVPKVLTLSLSEARSQVTNLGLGFGSSKGQPAPDPTLTNTVISQHPAPKTVLTNTGAVTVVVYDKNEENKRCRENGARFSQAIGKDIINLCHDILSESVGCAFYKNGIAQLKRKECLKAQSAYLAAVKAKNFRQAKATLARYPKCEFALGGAAVSLQCAENEAMIETFIGRNDMGGIKSVLSRSSHCTDFYSGYMNAVAQAEKNAAQRKKNKQLFWQALGGALVALSDASATNSNQHSGGNNANTGPPVHHQGTCNDVRHAGGNNPEIHTIDIGRGGRTFLFDYETHSQEDMVIVSQGGRVLFNSGCLGTNGTRTVKLKRASYSSKVTVEVRPNCNGGRGTSWSFQVHCPEKGY